MDVLFIHQNFPAQFIHIARALRRRPDVRVAVVTDIANTQPDVLPTARYRWTPNKAGASARISQNYAVRASRGAMVARAMVAVRNRGFNPSVVVGHLGWGETLFVKDVFPDAKLIVHAEFFYASEGADVGFDPEFSEDRGLDRRVELRAKNAAILAAMHEADIAVAPTRWQASRFPPEYQSKLTILHEGIDTDAIRPNAWAKFTDPSSGLSLDAGDEVITFVNRNLEPYRGYHVFMRALPAILAARPQARAVIVGGDDTSYGARPSGPRSWKDIFLDEVKDRLPIDRVHFVSRIPFSLFVSLMQISSAHVYLTYPFVLSWSMLQAMSAGAPLIASSTAPVLEVVRDEVNGALVDFFDVDGLSRRVIDVLAHPEAYRGARTAARETIIQDYDLARVCLPGWLDLIARKDAR
jgi:glycosyltransferase involved in cell wall biosynthesis